MGRNKPHTYICTICNDRFETGKISSETGRAYVVCGECHSKQPVHHSNIGIGSTYKPLSLNNGFLPMVYIPDVEVNLLEDIFEKPLESWGRWEKWHVEEFRNRGVDTIIGIKMYFLSNGFSIKREDK